MSRVFGRLLLASISLVAGSWVGLGAPNLGESRAFADRLQVREHLAALHASRNHAQPTSQLTTPTPPMPLTSTPTSIDPSLIPDTNLWPRLNPEQTTTRAWLLAEGPTHANDARKLVTLTFDDGPFPETTPTILRILARRHIRAAFFFIGRYLDGDSERATLTREVALQVSAAGHIIGNHTHDHACLTRLNHTQELAQIDDGASSIERVTGMRPVFFRPPYGQLDSFASSVLRERGSELVMWSVEVGDMLREDSEVMASSLKQQIDYSGGGIVLLHDIRPTSIPALEKLLTMLDEHRWDPAHPAVPGYQIVDLVDYIRATAASPQPFADRTELEHARDAKWRSAQKKAVPTIARSSESRDLDPPTM